MIFILLAYEYNFPLYNVTLAKANSEDLSSIENETFEVYSASLVLNLTENPEKMLSEAHRILKPKGRIGCSVWGERNSTTVMSIFPKILQENNI
jgi:ubiquinone/menaquinone biosynthesis C-methylase UbiE